MENCVKHALDFEINLLELKGWYFDESKSPSAVFVFSCGITLSICGGAKGSATCETICLWFEMGP